MHGLPLWEVAPEETFMETAKKTGIDEVTDFGIVPNSHLPHLLNAADIYVSTSLSDSGLAISTAEAMAWACL